jgi:hypothetical protein
MSDLARPVAIGVALVALFTFFFVYPGHDPEPNDLPVGIVGIEVEGVPGGFELREYPTPGAAADAVLDREVYGALGANNALVASAASPQVAEILRGIAGERRVTDLAPLDPDDPRGTSLNLVLLPLVVTAILGALLLSMAAAAPTRTRIYGLALFAILGGLAGMLVAKVALGVLPGSFVALWGVAALAIFALATCSSAIMRALGPPGTGAAFMLFLMLGSPASGAATAPHLLPDPWSWGGQLLPPGALATGLRNTAYFDAAQLPMWLGVLLVWSALGVTGLLLTRGRGPRPAEAP